MKQTPLKSYPNQNFTCDNCQSEFWNKTAFAAHPSLKITYCENCVEVSEEETKKQPNRKKTKDFGLPPQEVSQNLKALEIDKRTLRKTNRIHQFNTSVSEEWIEKLKAIAYEERLKYVEVLEKALQCYEKHRKN